MLHSYQALIFPIRYTEDSWKYLLLHRVTLLRYFTKRSNCWEPVISNLRTDKEKDACSAAHRALVETTGFSDTDLLRYGTYKEQVSHNKGWKDNLKEMAFGIQVPVEQEPQLDLQRYERWIWLPVERALEHLTNPKHQEALQWLDRKIKKLEQQLEIVQQLNQQIEQFIVRSGKTPPLTISRIYECWRENASVLKQKYFLSFDLTRNQCWRCRFTGIDNIDLYIVGDDQRPNVVLVQEAVRVIQILTSIERRVRAKIYGLEADETIEDECYIGWINFPNIEEPHYYEVFYPDTEYDPYLLWLVTLKDDVPITAEWMSWSLKR